MSTLQTIWSALTTPNETIIRVQGIPLNYLDAFVCMLFFTSVLNIETTRKRKLIYVITFGTIGNLVTFLVPTSYSVFVNIIVWPLMVFFILRASILKSILSEVITMVITSILDFIISSVFLNIFNINYDLLISTPLYRLIAVLSIYLIIFLLSLAVKYLRLNIKVIDNLNTKTKSLLILNIFLVIFIIAIQFYLVIISKGVCAT